MPAWRYLVEVLAHRQGREALVGATLGVVQAHVRQAGPHVGTLLSRRSL